MPTLTIRVDITALTWLSHGSNGPTTFKSNMYIRDLNCSDSLVHFASLPHPSPLTLLPSPFTPPTCLTEGTSLCSSLQSPPSLSDVLPRGRKPIFDDPVYEAGQPPPTQYCPPEARRPRKTSTLERSVQMFKEKVSSLKRSDSASAECLLSDLEDSGDYAKVPEVRHPSPPTQPPPPLPPRPLQHKNR